MPDCCDITDERLEKEAAIARKIRDRPHAISDECVECGLDIPEARQAATNGTDLCIDCATIYEHRVGSGRY